MSYFQDNYNRIVYGKVGRKHIPKLNNTRVYKKPEKLVEDIKPEVVDYTLEIEMTVYNTETGEILHQMQDWFEITSNEENLERDITFKVNNYVKDYYNELYYISDVDWRITDEGERY